MESWEDLIKTLPTDETLEQKEKSGELKDIDRKIEDMCHSKVHISSIIFSIKTP